jgi:hypothetical protein
MKKAKSVINKVKSIQSKVSSIENKINKVKNVVEHPLKSGGGYLGGKLGHKNAGERVGAFFGKITGTGDYQVSTNSLTTSSRTLSAPVPQFHPAKNGIRITHREYLGDIIASSTAGKFSLVSYPINPGLFSSFPWLCSIAAQFDQWKPNGMVVCINSLSSTYSGTSSLGTVVIATDYDVLDPTYSNKIEMENSQFATSGNSANSLIHPIECAAGQRSQPLYYTRTTGIAANDSLRFYDLGNVQVATAGCTASQVVGELWFSYDFTFYKPQIYGGIVGRTLLSYAASSVNTATTASPFAGVVRSAKSNFDVSYNLTDITFPVNLTSATLLVTIEWSSVTTVSTSGITFSYQGCEAGPLIDTNSSIANTGANTISTLSFTLKLTGAYVVTQTVTLVGGPTIVGTCGCYITISQLNPDSGF